MEKIFRLLPDKNLTCFVIKNAFSEQECKNFLRGRAFYPAATHYPPYYRNNDRLVIDDEQLAFKLWKKISELLPVSFQEGKNIWCLKKLNSKIRFCRYMSGQYFNKHLDGVYYESETVQSRLTFMLYLNGHRDFQGGRTLFFAGRDSDEIIQHYLPEPGDLIIFDHNIWHSGELVEEGYKYILRSDILYERISPEIAAVPEKNFGNAHLGYIWKLCSFDRLLLSGGRDKKIRSWDQNGKLIQEIEGHQNSILDLLKLNEKVLMSASRDQSIRLWNFSGDLFRQEKLILAHQSAVLSLCLLNNSSFISSDASGWVKKFTVNGEKISEWKAHQGWTWKVIGICSGIIASSGGDGCLRLWEHEKKIMISEFVNSSPIITLIFEPESSFLFAGDCQGIIRIFQITCDYSIKPITSFQAHKGIIRDMKLYNFSILLSAGEDNRVCLWDLKNLKCLASYQHQDFVQSLLLEDNVLYSASYDGQIKRNPIPELVPACQNLYNEPVI